MNDFENYDVEDTSSEFEKYCAELSGKDADGMPLATISYQCYAMEDDDNAPSKTVSYTLTTPWAQLWIDKMHPEYVCLDVAFRSADDPELRMMWNRLNRHIRNMSKNPEKTWIFYIRVLDNASTRIGQSEIKVAHIVNPLMFFLTRELPTVEAHNEETEFGLQGGNIIRMLIPVETVNIEVSPNEVYDIETIRAEVQRDMDDAEYQNAMAESGDRWNEDNTSF